MQCHGVYLGLTFALPLPECVLSYLRYICTMTKIYGLLQVINYMDINLIVLFPLRTI